MKIIFYSSFVLWACAHVFFFQVVENTWLYETEFANWNLYVLDRFWSPIKDRETLFHMLRPFSGYYGSFDEASDIPNAFSFWTFYILHIVGIFSIFLAWLAPVVFARNLFNRLSDNRIA